MIPPVAGKRPHVQLMRKGARLLWQGEEGQNINDNILQCLTVHHKIMVLQKRNKKAFQKIVNHSILVWKGQAQKLMPSTHYKDGFLSHNVRELGQN